MFNYCKLMRTTPKKKKCRKVYSGKVIFKIIKERVKKGLSLKSSTQTLSVLKTLLLTVTELLVRKIVLSRTDCLSPTTTKIKGQHGKQKCSKTSRLERPTFQQEKQCTEVSMIFSVTLLFKIFVY